MQEMQKIWVQSLGWGDSLEEGMATLLVFLPGESRGQRSLARYSVWGCRESDKSEETAGATLKSLTYKILCSVGYQQL